MTAYNMEKIRFIRRTSQHRGGAGALPKCQSKLLRNFTSKRMYRSRNRFLIHQFSNSSMVFNQQVSTIHEALHKLESLNYFQKKLKLLLPSMFLPVSANHYGKYLIFLVPPIR